MTLELTDLDLSEIIEQVDNLIDHLKNQGQLSATDIEFLRKIVFHLDSLILKINNQKNQTDFVATEIATTLTTANNHLRTVLLNEEKTVYQHPELHQQKNNFIFASLINQIKSV